MNFRYPVILASNSPRRKQLLSEAGIAFTVQTRTVIEEFPSDLDPLQVACYLARKKAENYMDLASDHIVICADTVVICDDHVLEKPENIGDAARMIRSLSDKTHQVITGVGIVSPVELAVFDSLTEVTFKDLSEDEIEYYIEHFKPFDKAGAYGIQEWIGLIGITGISGSYFNVVGLPVDKVYGYLQKFRV